MFRVLSWNVRGLNDHSKRLAVRQVISSFRNAVVCLQESKVRSDSCSFRKSFAGPFFDKCQFIEANGASGGLITCWNSYFFECADVIVRLFSITVHLTHRASGVTFFVTNVYGPPAREGKALFCSELATLKQWCGGNWVLCGDFNLTRVAEDRNGWTGGGRVDRMFNDLIFELALIDLPMLNQQYTWSNMQRSPILAKLDRFLVSTEWDATFPLSEVEALPRITSDHCPILLSTGGKHKRQGSTFRFEEVWLKCDDFVSRVPQWWQEVEGINSGILNFTAKLRYCRTRIKRWCASNFYSIRKEKKMIEVEIQELDRIEERQDLAPDQLDKRQGLRDTLSRVLDDEAIMWKTRAKQNWLKKRGTETLNFSTLTLTEGRGLIGLG